MIERRIQAAPTDLRQNKTGGAVATSGLDAAKSDPPR
jgi:hypothetical protein